MQFECKVFKLSLARCAPFTQPTRCFVQETEWIWMRNRFGRQRPGSLILARFVLALKMKPSRESNKKKKLWNNSLNHLAQNIEPQIKVKTKDSYHKANSILFHSNDVDESLIWFMSVAENSRTEIHLLRHLHWNRILRYLSSDNSHWILIDGDLNVTFICIIASGPMSFEWRNFMHRDALHHDLIRLTFAD